MVQTISTLVVLGASGDLSSRLLLPALGQLLTLAPDRRLTLVGSSVEEWTDAQWRARVRDSFSTVRATGEAVRKLLAGTHYRQADVTSSSDLQRLIDACEGTPALYFAIPPAVAVEACKAIEKVTLPVGTVLALEKPFGTDERSAHTLNAQLATIVPERQIYRVDHFLGRSMVFNLLGLRFANRIFEPVWSGQHIERVDIVYDEELGLEGRVGYYDHAGALTDMIQNHLLQVLAVVAMEPPSTLGADDLHDAKSLVLRATRVWKGRSQASSRRARYTAGTVGGRTLLAYVDEPGVDPSRCTETLAELTLEINTWRWAQVPFTLRSGKALGSRRREIVVTFKRAPHTPTGLRGADTPTVLRIFLAPDQMSLEINVNNSVDPHRIERATMNVDLGPGQLLAYAEVLDGVLGGGPSLSVSGDAAEQCWRIVAPALKSWKAGAVPLDDYAAGSAGPKGWSPVGA